MVLNYIETAKKYFIYTQIKAEEIKKKEAFADL